MFLKLFKQISYPFNSWFSTTTTITVVKSLETRSWTCSWIRVSKTTEPEEGEREEETEDRKVRVHKLLVSQEPNTRLSAKVNWIPISRERHAENYLEEWEAWSNRKWEREREWKWEETHPTFPGIVIDPILAGHHNNSEVWPYLVWYNGHTRDWLNEVNQSGHSIGF